MGGQSLVKHREVRGHDIARGQVAAQQFGESAAGLPGLWVYSLAIDPQTPTTLYAGTGANGIFKSVDGGVTWSDAELGPKPASSSSWRAWSLDWSAEPGEHELVVRATDEAGNTQPLDPSWNYGGVMNNMVQLVPVLVR